MVEKYKGYHGTLKRNVAEIMSSHFFTSNKSTEWLGKGIYFYPYCAHAWIWADDQCRKNNSRPDDEPAVLRVDIHVEEDNVLDLDNPDHKNELEEFFRKALLYLPEKREMLCKKDKTDPKLAAKLRRCLACDLYCDANDEIQMIVYTFLGRNKKDIKDEVYYRTERQLCVKDETIIKNVREVGRNGKEIS